MTTKRTLDYSFMLTNRPSDGATILAIKAGGSKTQRLTTDLGIG